MRRYRSIDRLIDAALAPLRPEDMPRSCQLLYEKARQLIGPGLWHSDAMAGALAQRLSRHCRCVER